MHQSPRRFQFLITQQRVERYQHAGVVTVRVGNETGDFGHTVAGIRPRSKSRTADIHRVGAMVDRLDTEVGITCGGKEFQRGIRGREGGWWHLLRGRRS